ncbi:MAG: hypothetical protein KC656_15195 [Myxococcales bacterium]|nr:hypothetical protein [Myxococcales bacterium]MCB9668245.1 hypothetical protein [Alphaproteobacteria bacterium]MCB9692585.1 hypothetical protein [Alphaproteobacteria bacterium]
MRMLSLFVWCGLSACGSQGRPTLRTCPDYGIRELPADACDLDDLAEGECQDLGPPVGCDVALACWLGDELEPSTVEEVLAWSVDVDERDVGCCGTPEGAVYQMLTARGAESMVDYYFEDGRLVGMNTRGSLSSANTGVCCSTWRGPGIRADTWQGRVIPVCSPVP